jgi:hypothetical protein
MVEPTLPPFPQDCEAMFSHMTSPARAQATFRTVKPVTPEQRMDAVSEDSRPPSNAVVTFLRETDGRLKLSWLS